MKKLSESARMRLIRQGQKQVEALTKRLATCDIKDFDRIKKALESEKVAVNMLLNG